MRVVLVRRVNDFSPSSPGRKRVPNEFEVHVDRFVIVTVPLFAKRFILICVVRERALFQGARFWNSRNRARVIRMYVLKSETTPRDTVGHIPVSTQVARPARAFTVCKQDLS